MAVHAVRIVNERRHFLLDAVVLVIIEVAMLVLAPTKESMDRTSSATA